MSENNLVTNGNNNNKESTNFNISLFVPSFFMKILEVEILKDEYNKDYKDYLVEINIGNKKIFNINKRFTDFININKNLKIELSRELVNFHENEIIFTEEFDFESNITAENIHFLECYFNEISQNPKIFHSNNFKKFFKIPDDEDNYQNNNRNHFGVPQTSNNFNNFIGNNIKQNKVL